MSDHINWVADDLILDGSPTSATGSQCRNIARPESERVVVDSRDCAAVAAYQRRKLIRRDLQARTECAVSTKFVSTYGEGHYIARLNWG
jgi:hypothetical protein